MEMLAKRKRCGTYLVLIEVTVPKLSLQIFCKEVVLWNHLKHPNVVPFLGATLHPPQLVSVWMPNKGLTEYVTAHPEKNRLRLVGFPPVVSGQVLTLFASYVMSLKVCTTFIPTILFMETSRK